MSEAPAASDQALWRLGAAEAARRIAAGELSSSALVAACLERIAEREETVRAWAHLDAGAALAEARERDAEAPRGPLHGVPVGVKDIVDTAGMPTERGSAIHAGRRPEHDAACVARLRAAGAVVLGKTVTTEFALYQPPRTANPAAPGRTPGGSSSGSAAAVADAMVPVAIGSQTAGSVVRPAAFCGTLGLKPTRGLVDLTGVMGLSANLDTLGWFARDGADLALLGSVLADAWPEAADAGGAGRGGDAAPPAFALARTPWWERADADSQHAVERAARRLADAGAPVREIELPERFAPLPEAHDALMAFDAARSLAHEREHHSDLLSDVLRALLDRGAGVPRETAAAAVALGAECRALLAEHLHAGESLLVPAVTGEPPALEEQSTGDPWFCRPWTLLGVPALAVPGATGASGAPVGVQLVAPAGADAALAAAGAWAAARLT
jgi:Asp-tRNA(Asn)/Glu-tRNA(Gln) amidotransferase A subunit family amidase